MVEFRSSTHLHSHLHSIRAIKDGSIKIVANVVGSRKSKLKFRSLVDIYSQGNTEDEVLMPRVVRDLENDSEMTQGSEVITETDSDGFDMTLEKMRKQCREKKRKRKGDSETAASQVKVKEESSLTLETEDEGCDVEEPLSLWNTKRRKKKQERKSKCGSTISSPSAKEVDLPVLCDVKLEASCDELVSCPVIMDVNETEDEGCDVEEPLSRWNTKRRKKKQELKTKCGSTSTPSAKKVDMPVFCDVKTEAPWDDSYSVTEAMDLIPINPLLESDKEPESTSNKELVEEVVHDLSKDTIVVLCCSPEANSPDIVDIEEPVTILQVDENFKDASEELIDARKSPCCLVDNLALENVLFGSASREEDVLEVEVPQSSESETIGCVKNLSYSYTDSGSEEVKEDDESNDSNPNLDMITTGLEFMKMDAPEILPGFDLTVTGLEIVKADAPEMLVTDISDSLTMDYGVGNTELVCENEDIANDELHEATDILELTGCCDSMDNLRSVPDDSTISLEEDHLTETLQPSSVDVDEAGDSQLFQAPTDEVTTAEEGDSIQQKELHSQPEKLLSGRKTLSPTSQAKLCKAIEHADSPERICKKSKGKLYFSNQNSHRILKAQGLEVDVVPTPKQAIQKAKINIRQTQFQRAGNKFPRRGTQAARPQPFSTGRTSLQGCTQKAIAFSQGQMRDFQYVAAKLTKELKSMRQITKRCLLAESNPSITPESNLDEVKTLIGKAEKTEESSKKWLSMIERDCNRFCKLMGMVREDSPATENIVQKTKKIKFADDAGGELCHVKVFENDLESES